MTKLHMMTEGHLGGCIQGGDPATWCPRLWSWVVQEFQIRSVLDVGCGEGHSTRAFRELGCEVLGVEGCQEAIDCSAIRECIAKHDFCDGPFIPDRPFDLIWSCEFLEHVEPEYVNNLLETFSHAGKLILLTHAFPGQRGHHHVNCQPNAYWISLFEQAGFRCDVGLSIRTRTITLGDYRRMNHYARSGLVIRKMPAASPAPATLLMRLDGSHAGFRPTLDARLKSLVISRRVALSRTLRRLKLAG